MSADISAALADRYRIEREIARGGMATVYLASDRKHSRAVAIKVLRPELAEALGPERFLREIETTAQLQHPHILPLFDSGSTAAGHLYYVMPYVAGESLRGRLDREKQLPLDEALEIARQIADALAYAHSRGVVHRDIKPENILLEHGHATLADFGIAKAVDAAGGEAFTQTGIAIGTPLYMSPEQASGESMLDGRSDLYSLACVLYEMLAGEPPYTGSSVRAIVAKRMHEPVPDVRTLRETVPPHVAEALRKSLARAPADRHNTAVQFSAALASDAPLHGRRPRVPWRQLAGAALVAVMVAAAAPFLVPRMRGAHAQQRIAVLAPRNLSDGDTQAPIVWGLYDGLITHLGEAGVHVVGGVQTMMQYRGERAAVRDVARALGVEAVVEPSVAWTGDSVTVNVRLLNGRTEAEVWADEFQSADADVLVLMQQVARAIAAETGGARGRAVSVAARTVNPAAHRAYLQGAFYMKNLTEADLDQALAYFQAAITADSSYAPAYAGMSWTWVARQQMGFVPPAEATPIAVRLAQRAVTLDSLLPEAHHARAAAEGWAAWNWTVAEQEYRRALSLDPAFGDAHSDLSHVLLIEHRYDEARVQADSAVALDPLNVKYQMFRAGVYGAIGEVAEARQTVENILRVIPNNPAALSILALLTHQQGEDSASVRYRVAAWRSMGFDGIADEMDRSYAASGFRATMVAAADSAARLGRVGWVPPIDVADLYAIAEDTSRALDWLERALAVRDPNLPYVGILPHWAFLRGHPRFEAVLEALHLPQTSSGASRN